MDSELTLLNVCSYRDKAKKDAEDIYNRCQAIMEDSGNSPITLKPEDVQLFCKEARNLELIRGQPIYEELETCPTEIVNEIGKKSFMVIILSCYSNRLSNGQNIQPKTRKVLTQIACST